MQGEKSSITLTVEIREGGDGAPEITGHGTATFAADIGDWDPAGSEDILIRVRGAKQTGPRELELVVLDVTEAGPGYATLTEHNEWEGETWRFYIPL
ncbi:MAG: hypothetical protein LC749_01605, partial [Actinobacteria bacterium]|nr:hypothetical protein [Actinomycetota bacterium]